MILIIEKMNKFCLKMCNFKNHDFLGQKHTWPKGVQMCYKIEFHQNFQLLLMF